MARLQRVGAAPQFLVPNHLTPNSTRQAPPTIMSSRKRSRQDQETLQLKLADCCLTVDAGTVRSASELAGGLPAGATEWDLSGLILDGQPVERDTVVQVGGLQQLLKISSLSQCLVSVH